MPRQASSSPVSQRQELNARALIDENITKPIILSRDGDHSKRRSTARLSQVRGNVLAEMRLETPQNMYDYDDAASLSTYSTEAPSRGGRSTKVNLPASRRMERTLDADLVPYRRSHPDVVPYNDYHHRRHYHNDMDDQDSVISTATASTRISRYHNNYSDNGVSRVAVIPYSHDPYYQAYPYRRDEYVRRRHHRSHVYETVPVSPWYVVLKIAELVVCLIIIIITRVGFKDLELDIVFTMFGFVGLCIAGLSLLLMWIKGQPDPNNCLHPLVLFAYLITAAIMLCGAILVLTQDDLNGYAAGTSAMFFLALILFTADAVLMAIALMLCPCLPFPDFLKPRQQHHSRIHVRARSKARTYPIVVENRTPVRSGSRARASMIYEGRDRRRGDSYPATAIDDNPDYYYVRYHRRSPRAHRHSVYSGDGGGSDYYGNNGNNSRHYLPPGELLHEPAYIDRHGEYLRDRYPPVGNPRTLPRMSVHRH